MRLFRFAPSTRQTVRLSIGSAAAACIAFGVSPLLTRFFGPESLGLFGVFSAITAIFALIATGRFDQAIPLPKNEAEAAGLHRLALRCTLATGLVVACFLPWRVKLAVTLGHPGLGPWLNALPPSLVLGAWLQIETAWASRQQAFGKIAIGRTVQSAVTATIQVAFAFAGWIALPAGLIVGLAAQIGIMRTIRPESGQTSKQQLSILARNYSHFPLYTLPAALLDLVTQQIPLICGSLFFGAPFAGYYTLSNKVMSLPAAFIGGPFAQVFYPEFAEKINRGENARLLLFSAWKKLAALGAVPFLLLAYFGPRLFVYVFGVNWRPAGEIAVVIGPMLFTMLISSPTSGAMLALQGQRISACFSAWFPLYRFTCLWWGHVKDSALLGLAVLALIEVITIFVFNIILLRRLSVRTNEFPPMQASLPS